MSRANAGARVIAIFSSLLLPGGSKEHGRG